GDSGGSLISGRERRALGVSEKAAPRHNKIDRPSGVETVSSSPKWLLRSLGFFLQAWRRRQTLCLTPQEQLCYCLTVVKGRRMHGCKRRISHPETCRSRPLSRDTQQTGPPHRQSKIFELLVA